MIIEKKLHMRLLQILLALLVVNSAFGVTNYYVDADTGDDDDNGGIGDPFLTIARALSEISGKIGRASCRERVLS